MEEEIEDDTDNDLTLFLTMVESWKHFINLTHDFSQMKGMLDNYF